MISVYYDQIKDPKLFFIKKSLFPVTSLDKCDIILHNEILWSDPETQAKLHLISTKYSGFDKFVVVFIVDDYEGKYVFYQNLLLIRTSLQASKRRQNEFSLPYIWEGSVEPFASSKLLDKPSISFCGLNSIHRKEIIEIFRKSSQVESNFIIREHFWGGSPHDVQIVQDFKLNMLQNPFVVAQRGNGNFSMRFYQALACGRIPVLVNTDMLLPFNNKIDWSKYAVFEKNASSCLKKVVTVFENGEYLTMQQDCFTLYNKFFSLETFMDQLLTYILTEYCKPSTKFKSKSINLNFFKL